MKFGVSLLIQALQIIEIYTNCYREHFTFEGKWDIYVYNVRFDNVISSQSIVTSLSLIAGDLSCF